MISICDVADAIPKSDLGSMEHPFYSLSTKPDTRIREYSHNDVSITITPSVTGLATIHDKDILIYCISQLIAKMNAGVTPQRTLHIKAYDLLVATNRRTDGQAYRQLTSAFERLSGTRIKTNLKSNGEEIEEGFGLIDSWRIIRQESGRMSEVRVNISYWVFNAVCGAEVLTLNRGYFRLRKPLERRLYELGRKHCGSKPQWKVSLGIIQNKCGSASTLKEFRRLVTRIVIDDHQHQHFPDYALSLDDDMLTFVNRNSTCAYNPSEDYSNIKLKSETIEEARALAPGWDVYLIESEWRDWMPEAPRDADAVFLSFCSKWYERRGSPA